MLFTLFWGGLAHSASSGACEITEVSTLDPIMVKLSEVDRDTLVIFDIVRVLIERRGEISRNSGEKKKKDNCKTASVCGSDKSDSCTGCGSKLKDGYRFVDRRIVPLIKGLLKKGVKVVALTSGSVGDISKIEDYEKWRVGMLKEFGIDFSGSFKNIGHVVFSGLEPAISGGFPSYRDGIIFCRDSPKGEVLKAFLKQYSCRPSKIVFIDDKRRHLESVGSVAKELGAEFNGFQYTADTVEGGEP